MTRFPRHNLFVLALATFAGTATLADDPLPRNQLRHIVQEQCLPAWSTDHSPGPCERLTPPDRMDVDDGYAVLHDRKGGIHFLLIPTARITGIEDPALLSGHLPNYFDAAWRNRDILDRQAGASLRRDQIGFAVNHVSARSQDQLHIHMSCIRPDLTARLTADADTFDDHWQPWSFEDRSYAVRRVNGESLGTADPFRLLHELLSYRHAEAGSHTLLVAGLTYATTPGFVLVAGTNVPGAERLLDSRCTSAQG